MEGSVQVELSYLAIVDSINQPSLNGRSEDGRGSQKESERCVAEIHLWE
jgi:hypothetical protein